jgi:S-adenosylmethionine hydrolase
MAIVTLTSDMGEKDFYLAALKGAIYSHCGNISVTDISHSVKPFDIKDAAYIIRHAYKYFPKGTLHVVHVNPQTDKTKMLVSVVDGHYFLTFDNGILSLAFEKTPHETYQINNELLENNTLLYDEAIAKVIDLLLKEYRLTDFAHLTTDTVSYRSLQPMTSPGSIRGTIMYVDHYGNAISNITRKMFDEFIGSRRFSVFCNAANTKTISRTYADVEEGEMVCLFNSAGYLEVAMNKGKASQLMGLKVESAVLVIAD